MKKIYSTTELRERLMPIFHDFGIIKAILFGSYGKGIAKENSDLDLFIDSNGKIRGIDFFSVRARISDALEMTIDLIEARQLIKGGKIEKEIFSTGVIIYDQAG